jgi:hypothetical protein
LDERQGGKVIHCRHKVFFVYVPVNSRFNYPSLVVSLEAQQKSTGAAVVGDFRPVAGFVASLMAGVLILAGGVSMLGYSSGLYSGRMGSYGGMMGGSGGMMSGYYGMMQGFGGWFYGFAVLGIAAGVLVLFGAIMMYDRPREAAMWGALVLGFSVVSFFGAGGFFIGAVLGILGGILALTWREAGQQSDKRL